MKYWKRFVLWKTAHSLIQSITRSVFAMGDKNLLSFWSENSIEIPTEHEFLCEFWHNNGKTRKEFSVSQRCNVPHRNCYIISGSEYSRHFVIIIINERQYTIARLQLVLTQMFRLVWIWICRRSFERSRRFLIYYDSIKSWLRSFYFLYIIVRGYITTVSVVCVCVKYFFTPTF